MNACGTQVLECESLRMVEKTEHSENDYPIAFMSERKKKGKKPKRRVEYSSDSCSDSQVCVPTVCVRVEYQR